MSRLFAAASIVLLASSFAIAHATKPATQPAREDRTGRFDAKYPFPPAGQFMRFVGPVAKNYAIGAHAGSFAELRAVECMPDGKIHRPPAGSFDASTDADYIVYVPASYAHDGEAHGVIVWLAPEPGLQWPQQWQAVLDRHKLILIEPRRVHNSTFPVWRTFMALESVRQAKFEFNVDPQRVYVSGLSGGGRISSHAAIFFPDTFTGAFCMVGVDCYRNVPTGGGRAYLGFWKKPDMQLVLRARQNTRLVLLTGENDFNRDSTKAVYDAYVKEKWKHVTLFDVPKMGHQMPDAEWFEKGVVALDSKAETKPTTQPKE